MHTSMTNGMLELWTTRLFSLYGKTYKPGPIEMLKDVDVVLCILPQDIGTAPVLPYISTIEGSGC